MTEEEKKKKAAQDAAIAAAVSLGIKIGYGNLAGIGSPHGEIEGGDVKKNPLYPTQNYYRTQKLPKDYANVEGYLTDHFYNETYSYLNNPNTQGGGELSSNPTPTPTPTPGETGNTGETGGTGGTGGEQPPITYDEGSKTVFQLIEEQKNASYAAAQAQRERAIIDAKTSYAQNLATYGKNAEALAGSGLGGSGYGEYLGASAYAQQRADIQAAKAAESAAKNAADRVYYADMAAQTEKANAAYLTLMDAAKSGGYTAKEIRAAAQKQGITSEEDIKALTSEAEAAKYAEFSDAISYDAADTNAIDKSFAKGEISQEQYNELKNTWNSDIDTGKSFFYSDGVLLSRKDAEEALAEISKNKWLSEENKQKLEAEFEKIYDVKTGNSRIEFNNDGGFLFFGSTKTGEGGNNFSVKDKAGNKYRVEYGGAASEDVNYAAKDLADNTVFGYQNKIYIKKNGKAYIINQRASTYPDHYNKLYNLLFK